MAHGQVDVETITDYLGKDAFQWRCALSMFASRESQRELQHGEAQEERVCSKIVTSFWPCCRAPGHSAKVTDDSVEIAQAKQ